MLAIMNFIRQLFLNNLNFASDMFDRSVAVRLAMIGVFISLFTGFYALINGLFSAIAVSTPSWIAIPASWLVPTNFDACVTVIVTAWVGRAALNFHAKLIGMYAGSTGGVKGFAG